MYLVCALCVYKFTKLCSSDMCVCVLFVLCVFISVLICTVVISHTHKHTNTHRYTLTNTHTNTQTHTHRRTVRCSPVAVFNTIKMTAAVKWHILVPGSETLSMHPMYNPALLKEEQHHTVTQCMSLHTLYCCK